MKRKIMAILISFLIGMVVLTGSAIAGMDNSTGNGNQGPAPNSGDCIPDGSGFDSQNGSNGDGSAGNGHGGPAPNSGDGIPDGPGW